ncbi:hypothetical protein D1007_26579 [Hordeum vulgare]|nr:hypothetical protein D1007_26579 [Hordeum vulgare]
MRIVDELYDHHKNKFAKQWTILTHQFYAIVQFGNDDSRTLTFMCRDDLFTVPWRSFCKALWPGEPLSSPKNITEHEFKKLRKKKQAAPRFPEDTPEDVFATSSESEFELPTAAKPSWVSKFSDKFNKNFCLQAHVQKHLYEAHVNEKLARRRHIRIMPALKLEATSGSEKYISPEEKWIYGHTTWTDDEVSGQPATSSTTAAQDVSDSDDGDAHDESASGDSED